MITLSFALERTNQHKTDMTDMTEKTGMTAEKEMKWQTFRVWKKPGKWELFLIAFERSRILISFYYLKRCRWKLKKTDEAFFSFWYISWWRITSLSCFLTVTIHFRQIRAQVNKKIPPFKFWFSKKNCINQKSGKSKSKKIEIWD